MRLVDKDAEKYQGAKTKNRRGSDLQRISLPKVRRRIENFFGLPAPRKVSGFVWPVYPDRERHRRLRLRLT
jgi:hypothetical protein